MKMNMPESRMGLGFIRILPILGLRLMKGGLMAMMYIWIAAVEVKMIGCLQ
jgi:hypothetical protein